MNDSFLLGPAPDGHRTHDAEFPESWLIRRLANLRRDAALQPGPDNHCDRILRDDAARELAELERDIETARTTVRARNSGRRVGKAFEFFLIARELERTHE